MQCSKASPLVMANQDMAKIRRRKGQVRDLLQCAKNQTVPSQFRDELSLFLLPKFGRRNFVRTNMRVHIIRSSSTFCVITQ